MRRKARTEALVIFTIAGAGSSDIEDICFKGITPQTNLSSLCDVYKDVFSGPPWYEELYCSDCQTAYTTSTLNPNEVRDNLREIDPESERRCLQCDKDLIEYYPDFIDNRKLVKESLSKKGFIGYSAEDVNGKSLVGFGWGYKIPTGRTQSVDFPIVSEMLVAKELNPNRTFYGAELGVTGNLQRKGVGLILSGLRLQQAASSYELFIIRTINPAVHRIIEKLFSRKKGIFLFDDPENKTPWYAWNFADFNNQEVNSRIRGNEDEK